MTEKPFDATGKYQDYNGRVTWIKDVTDNQQWMMGRLWSDAQKRWRAKREHVYADKVLPLDKET